MGKTNYEGQVKIYKRDKYVYYLASITLLRKNHRKYFEFNEEGKAQAEAWLSEMRGR